MCHYCGCRQIPLIRDFIAEHELVLELGMRALEQAGHGAFEQAGSTVEAMRAELRSHWQGEEEGIFALMRTDELYRQHIDPLVDEHRELGALLAGLDLGRADDRDLLHHQMTELRIHISKEEDGIFPVTLVEFSGPEWDAAIAAWERAHPGRTVSTR
ncbi:hemerythrin domain-containing protein [Nocardioides sp. zg-1228]|uniref:hemerythrin domain-containing protein n=1 Tax=Nocardioides sp. zg-1228 TaxID=2763008 RepID=UPI0016435616|nr:hemerythrin domain-containing protein [Nocardioides sp. zg-1228]MBC2932806.1 hemerythrin domain-containing protein [Nocardioides sp. zg-1228]QSF58277.1 hemerythrin domain-containing protein [Nocardioides sp. zg-1228]